MKWQGARFEKLYANVFLPDVMKGMAKHAEAVGKRYGLKLVKEK